GPPALLRPRRVAPSALRGSFDVCLSQARPCGRAWIRAKRVGRPPSRSGLRQTERHFLSFFTSLSFFGVSFSEPGGTAASSSLPSPEKPTPITWCVCPSNDFRNLPDGTSNVLTNLSAPHVASILSSGLNATPKTVSECTLVVTFTATLPSATVISLTSPSCVAAPPPVASSLLSLLNASATTRSA